MQSVDGIFGADALVRCGYSLAQPARERYRMSSISGLRKVSQILTQKQKLEFLTALLAADNHEKYFFRFKSDVYQRMNNRVGISQSRAGGSPDGIFGPNHLLKLTISEIAAKRISDGTLDIGR